MPLPFFTVALPLIIGFVLFVGISGRFLFFYQTRSRSEQAIKRRAQWISALTVLTLSGVLTFIAHTSLTLTATPFVATGGLWLLAIGVVVALTRVKPTHKRRRRRRHTHLISQRENTPSAPSENDTDRHAQQTTETDSPFDLHSIEDPYESLWPERMSGYAAEETPREHGKPELRSTETMALASAYEIIHKERQQRAMAEKHLRVTRKALAKMSRESGAVRPLVAQ